MGLCPLAPPIPILPKKADEGSPCMQSPPPPTQPWVQGEGTSSPAAFSKELTESGWRRETSPGTVPGGQPFRARTASAGAELTLKRGLTRSVSRLCPPLWALRDRDKTGPRSRHTSTVLGPGSPRAGRCPRGSGTTLSQRDGRREGTWRDTPEKMESCRGKHAASECEGQ